MEKTEKLNLSEWSDKNRQRMLSLIDLLSDKRRSHLSEHLVLLRHPPPLNDSREEFKKYLAIPTTFALLIYGAEELDALYELAAIKTETLKEMESDKAGEFIHQYIYLWQWASQALLAVALGRDDVVYKCVRVAHAYLNDEAFGRLVQDIRNTCKRIELQHEARRQLSRVVHSLTSEPSERFRLSHMLDMITSPFEASGVDRSDVLGFVLELVAQGTLNVSDSVCHDLEALISRDLPEREYQEYFERHPALIDPLASSIVERQHMGEMWRSDFVIRRLDDQYIFVEIEKPQDNPFTSYPHPSAALSHALGQVLNWFAWIEDNIAYAQSHGFPGIHSPRGIVVIGRNGDLNTPQLRMLKTLNDILHPRIRIETYDDVLLNARNIIRNLTAK